MYRVTITPTTTIVFDDDTDSAWFERYETPEQPPDKPIRKLRIREHVGMLRLMAVEIDRLQAFESVELADAVSSAERELDAILINGPAVRQEIVDELKPVIDPNDDEDDEVPDLIDDRL